MNDTHRRPAAEVTSDAGGEQRGSASGASRPRTVRVRIAAGACRTAHPVRAADQLLPAAQRLQPARGHRRRAGRDRRRRARPSRPASGRCSTTSCGLREVRVEDVMVPRADIEAVEISTTLGELMSLFEQSGHSRMPVYAETLDDPRGMVHIRDVLAHITRSRAASSRPRARPQAGRCRRDARSAARSTSPRRSASSNLIRSVLFVPPSMLASDLMARMQATRTQMALVIDEYGGTDGLVSLEDIVEMVVGDIEDEHDDEDEPLIDAGRRGHLHRRRQGRDRRGRQGDRRRLRRRRARRICRHDRRHDLQHARPRAGARRGGAGRSPASSSMCSTPIRAASSGCASSRIRAASAAAGRRAPRPPKKNSRRTRAGGRRGACARPFRDLAADQPGLLILCAPIRFERAHSWNAWPAGSYCCGVGGAREWRSWPAPSPCFRRRPTISSPPASSPFRSWSGCSTAPPPSARRLLGRLRPAFAIGWWFGFGYFVAGLWWVGGALLVEADEFAWALPFAVVFAAGDPGDLLRPRHCAGARLLERRHRPHRGARGVLRAGRMAAHLHLHRLSVESDRLARRCRCRC